MDDQYEYAVRRILHLDSIERTVNRLAGRGWRLIAVVDDLHYFERKKGSGEPEPAAEEGHRVPAQLYR